jgi:hypothetical protein
VVSLLACQGYQNVRFERLNLKGMYQTKLSYKIIIRLR